MIHIPVFFLLCAIGVMSPHRCPVDLLPLAGMSVVNRYNMVTGVPPWPMLKH
jgi:hypothetical protein